MNQLYRYVSYSDDWAMLALIFAQLKGSGEFVHAFWPLGPSRSGHRGLFLGGERRLALRRCRPFLGSNVDWGAARPIARIVTVAYGRVAREGRSQNPRRVVECGLQAAALGPRSTVVRTRE
ncbi:hypothetical protein PsYK624_137250 [Phanerochaete sordida]|uniref:Uncharacterized protein n=1 Tax=Phanerochaete sordida TaxID=48140 RepID=A0A9P3GQA3_9APHY|nr:hypothetical protein PsYK624_137250 [Phanerochaete sordida]